MPAARINGTTLEYWESGAGAPVVFVHGSLADHRTWHRQKMPFSRHYRAIGYSRRCHFPNPAADAGSDYSAASHAADLGQLVRQLTDQPAHIVASSFGGYIALYLAVHQPGLVRSLVLGEPPVFPWLEEIAGGAALLASFMHDAWEPARRSFAAGASEEGIRYFLDGVLGRGIFDAMKPGARTGVMDNAAEMALEAASPLYFSRLTREEVRRISLPVLLLGGAMSPPIFTPILDELERCLPQADRCTIPAASHSLHIENPAAYNAAVLGFLEKS
jgi:pimeloyl-ACP methyl ester carboxylesterase